MAPKSAKSKAAKQKKILLLLAPVLVILVVLQGPKLMKAFSPPANTESEAAETSPASAEGAATDPAAPITPSASGILIESDVPPAPDEGQLISFGRFTGKDPFRQLVQAEEDDSGAGSGGDSSGGDESGGDSGEEPSGEDGDVPNTAELTVNEAAESVKVGGSFPSADPIFRLASIEGSIAKIGLVTGSFSTGVATLDLKVGETLTLVSQPDGVRYKIKLLDVLIGGAASESTPDVIPDSNPDATPESPDSGSQPPAE
jgi:hypothetical protein